MISLSADPSVRQALPANDTYQEPIQVDVNTSVRVNPGAGGTITVLYTLSSVSEVEAGTAIWNTSPAFGAVAAVAEDEVISRLTAIKAKQTGGVAGSIEVRR